MNAKLPPGTLEKLWNDSHSWRGNVIYYCKADPRLIVPKPIRWTGWTMNFAHAAAWVYLIVGIVLAVLVIVAGAAFSQPWGIVVAVVLVAGLSIVLGIVFASPRRFERKN